MIKLPKDYTNKEKEASYGLLRRGYFRHLFLGKQKLIHDMWHSLKPTEEMGALLSRKQGKSFSSILLSIQFCLQYPNTIVKYATVTLKAGRELVIPIMNELKDILPIELFPRLLKSELKYIFPNGSYIHIVGLDPDGVDGARGSRSDITIFDEAGFIVETGGNFSYAVYSVLLPMMLTSPHNKTLWITTPSNSVNHPFQTEILPRLTTKGRLITYNIYDSPFVTPELIETLRIKYEHDPEGWDREYLCKAIPNKKLQVTPEFSADEHVITTLPAHKDEFGGDIKFDVYIGVDTALKDQTAIVGGYWHWSFHKFIIVYNKSANNLTIPQIAEAVQQACKELMIYAYDSDHIHITIDCFEIVRYTLQVEHNLQFFRPKKRQVVDTISLIRQYLIQGKLLILSDCIPLITELSSCIWTDRISDTPQIERTIQGHGDNIMALAYLLRFVKTNYIPSTIIPWSLD